VSVDVNVAVDVIDTVTVAVHVHGNATVIVIQPVDGSDATSISSADPRNRSHRTSQSV